MDHFENTTLYSESSDNQKNDAQSLFKEFVNKNKDRLEKCKEVLDVGCGTGETLIDFMLPCLKQECVKVTGIDVSREMIKFATEKYGNKNRNFYVLDIQSELKIIEETLKPGSFDLITLSYCYHWVQNEEAALRSIFSLLKPGGLCFMIFPVNHIFYKVCLEQAQVEKFQPYLKLENFISRHFYSKNPVPELKGRIEAAGLKIRKLELRKINFTFPSIQHLGKTFSAIIPFKMPETLKKEFVNKSAKMMATMGDLDHVTDDGGLNFSYELMNVAVYK